MVPRTVVVIPEQVGAIRQVLSSGEEAMSKDYFSPLKWSAALVGLLIATFLVPAARGEEPKLSISGYDPVAYFTDGKPVQGKAEIEYLWHKLRWRFANSERSEERRVGKECRSRW